MVLINASGTGPYAPNYCLISCLLTLIVPNFSYGPNALLQVNARRPQLLFKNMRN